MSFVRLLPDHQGLNPLCSPPMNMNITREEQPTEAA